MESYGIIASVFSLASYLTYFRAMTGGRTQPNGVSWLIWSVVNGINAVIYFSLGARSTLYVPLVVTVGCFLTFLLSLKYGSRSWNFLDKACLVGTAAVIVLWAVFSPIVGLLGGICVNFLALPPTLLKIWKEPDTEDALTWTLKMVGYVINVVAIDTWVFRIWIYPVYGIVASTTVLLFLLVARFLRSH